MSTNTKIKQKIKLFRKTYFDLQTTVKTCLRRPDDQIFSIKTIEQVNLFEFEIDKNIDLYNTKDFKLIPKITILHNIFNNKPVLSKTNKETVWNYIEVLYSLAKQQNKQISEDLINNEGLSSIVNDLMNDKESGFNDMISDISSQVTDMLKGKDINKTDLIQQLLSGNTNANGLDFQSIIEKTSAKFKAKADAGEIDVNKIRETASRINNSIGNFNLKEKK